MFLLKLFRLNILHSNDDRVDTHVLMKLLHLVLTGYLIMLTTFTSFVGPSTRSRVRSSSETLRSMEEMMGTMEQLAKRKRGASKRSTTMTPESVSTADSEMAISSPRSDPFSRGNDEPVALQVWNELFEGDNFGKIAETIQLHSSQRCRVSRVCRDGKDGT